MSDKPTDEELARDLAHDLDLLRGWGDDAGRRGFCSFHAPGWLRRAIAAEAKLKKTAIVAVDHDDEPSEVLLKVNQALAGHGLRLEETGRREQGRAFYALVPAPG